MAVRSVAGIGGSQPCLRQAGRKLVQPLSMPSAGSRCRVPVRPSVGRFLSTPGLAPPAASCRYFSGWASCPERDTPYALMICVSVGMAIPIFAARASIARSSVKPVYGPSSRSAERASSMLFRSPLCSPTSVSGESRGRSASSSRSCCSSQCQRPGCSRATGCSAPTRCAGCPGGAS